MEPIIAKCGRRCDLCPAYETNITSDADKQRMSDAWKKYCGFDVPPDVIKSCSGCLAGGGDETCTVRPCAIEKNLDNCAHCEQFACDKLKPKMNFVQENIKDPENIPKEDYDSFIKPFLGEENLLKIKELLEN